MGRDHTCLIGLLGEDAKQMHRAGASSLGTPDIRGLRALRCGGNPVHFRVCSRIPRCRQHLHRAVTIRNVFRPCRMSPGELNASELGFKGLPRAQDTGGALAMKPASVC